MRATETQLRDWMVASLAGDAAAYRTLLDELRARLIPFFARRLGGGRAEVDDLVQETLIAIHTKRATYDPVQPFTGWAYAIARYKLVDHFRRSGRRPTTPIDAAGDLFVDDEGGAVEARLDVERLMQSLSPRDRDLVGGVKLQGWSTQQASARTGMSQSAVKVAVHRALKRLTARVRSQDHEGG